MPKLRNRAGCVVVPANTRCWSLVDEGSKGAGCKNSGGKVLPVLSKREIIICDTHILSNFLQAYLNYNTMVVLRRRQLCYVRYFYFAGFTLSTFPE